jgi:F-type H+-transporting ATPase subunit c
MNRKFLAALLFGCLSILMASHAFAADMGAPAYGHGDKAFFFSVVAASCAFGMSIASSICGLAQSKAIARAMDGIARQPSAYKDIQTLLIIGLALIESLALYVLVVALILIYASPFTGLITG